MRHQKLNAVVDLNDPLVYIGIELLADTDERRRVVAAVDLDVAVAMKRHPPHGHDPNNLTVVYTPTTG